MRRFERRSQRDRRRCWRRSGASTACTTTAARIARRDDGRLETRTAADRDRLTGGEARDAGNRQNLSAGRFFELNFRNDEQVPELIAVALKYDGRP